MIPKNLILYSFASLLLFWQIFQRNCKADTFVNSLNNDRIIIYTENTDSIDVHDSLSSIISLALNEKKISDLLNMSYVDSTIYNEINVEDAKYNDGEDILLSIRQIQPKIQHSVNLIFLVYHRKSKQFFVLEPLTEKQIPIDKWNSDL